MIETVGAICRERGGEVYREAREMPRDLHLWLAHLDKLRTVPNFLFKSDFENTEVFLDDRNLFFEIDDVGLALALPKANGDAEIHITFWDGKLRGREGLMKKLADTVKAELGLSLLYTAVPEESAVVLAFARRVGFEEIGRGQGAVWLAY